MRHSVVAGLAFLVAQTTIAAAQVSDETVRSLSAPDRVETRIGTLEFKDGVPSVATAQTVYDTLAFANGLAVYNNSFRGASAYAIRKGSTALAPRTTPSSSSPS
ncbi:hypothetical protein KXR53_15100 [Inquilinus limosus]|uniref:hypothetical protein n=1 Tax=Inquilinus limosus TaxID=171674 RepID=UPI003F1479B4